MFRSKKVAPSANVVDLRNPKPKPRFKPSRRQILIATGSLVIITAGLFTWWQTRHRLFFPALISENASYQLYYPSKMPKGFKLATNSFSATTQVTIFYLQNDQEQKIFFS